MELECGYAALSEGWGSRNVGGIVERTAERLLEAKKRRGVKKRECDRESEEAERKVET